MDEFIRLSHSDFFESQDRFKGLVQSEQILRAAWFVQTHEGLTRFQPKDITRFFSMLHLETPNVHVNIKRLCEKKPRTILYDKSGYFLEGKFRRSIDDKLLPSSDSVRHLTSQSLRGISDVVAEPAERTYLAEAISCYRVGAFRATIVMVWNLAYDHFIRWVVSDKNRIDAFNASLAIKYPKKKIWSLRHLKIF